MDTIEPNKEPKFETFIFSFWSIYLIVVGKGYYALYQHLAG